MTSTIYDVMGTCPLRKILSVRGIVGIAQFHSLRSLVLRRYVLDHMTKPDPAGWHTITEPRIQREITEGGYEKKLTQFLESFTGDLLDDKTEHVQTADGELQIQYLTGHMGLDPAIFVIHIGERAAKENGYALLLGAEQEYGSLAKCPANLHLVILLPLAEEPEIREIPCAGKMTGKGLTDKRDMFGSWQTLHDNVWALIAAYWNDMQSPTYEPVFGSCLTCPYHNVPVDCDGEHYRCVG